VHCSVWGVISLPFLNKNRWVIAKGGKLNQAVCHQNSLGNRHGFKDIGDRKITGMFINSKTAEESAIINAANAICAAVRTAPKACRIDHLDTAIITATDKDALANEMRKIGEALTDGDGRFFVRDADNVDTASAVVLIGAKYLTRGLGEMCGLCGFANCAECSKAGAACVFTAMDLGIALGSAAALLADARIDNRIMFTIGKAAASLGLLGEYKMVIGIPLSDSGKTPFFDREPI
jgi:uncharacterized ferredoxin-like protein